ncbi:DinB family protein [Streptomyces sp. ME18-1-4]|uniref:DinB family protein n=1 Tax=Streptomyces sp. ME18-1-4 TaxID=3028685 RepID=UPI0029BE880A|nr:DinB family protein [Streptomyces sp. ME18-1-4]MDX3246780.1 DinB family protein [Streptomyces sp. ME18-1-4]
MTTIDPKADLRRYLQDARETVLWKLDGLTERDVRRPLTPTGTNLLGLVKHLAGVELLYLGWVFDRHYAEPVPWFRPDLGPAGLAPNTDQWATAEESRQYIVDTYRKAWQHADATIEALPLDAVGHVPWWPAQTGAASLHRVLVNVIAETERHTGHADIVRELIDGAVGYRRGTERLPAADEQWWAAYRDRVAAVAEQS